MFILSDDKKIKNISKKYGFDTSYIRPKKVSTSKTSLVDTLLDFVKFTDNIYDYDYLVILQPTSPLRNHKDINKAIELVKSNKAQSLASVSEAQEHPYEQIIINNNEWKFLMKKSKNFSRRQDFDIKVFFITGGIYIIDKKILLKEKKIFSKKHVNFLTSKLKSLDINDYDDLKLAKKIL